MYVYAGIDEAGYGPLLGPLLIGRAVLTIPKLDADSPQPPLLWNRLSKAVCHNLVGRKGRIVVNDSKKLKTKAAGIAHLERGVLAFAALAGHEPETVCDWLNLLGDRSHHQLDNLPWYAPCDAFPWDALPSACDQGDLAVARGMLRTTAGRIGVNLAEFGAAVVFEDRFNRIVGATRNKAVANMSFVAEHLDAIWQTHGRHHPHVYVDRQSGRSHYRTWLQESFPNAQLQVLDEAPQVSAYILNESASGRRMHVTFQVEAEQSHMPVALASMVSKYTRELMMNRLNAWFTHRAPNLKPTAGYALDGRRFLDELRPLLPQWSITESQLARIS